MRFANPKTMKDELDPPSRPRLSSNKLILILALCVAALIAASIFIVTGLGKSKPLPPAGLGEISTTAMTTNPDMFSTAILQTGLNRALLVLAEDTTDPALTGGLDSAAAGDVVSSRVPDTAQAEFASLFGPSTEVWLSTPPGAPVNTTAAENYIEAASSSSAASVWIVVGIFLIGLALLVGIPTAIRLVKREVADNRARREAEGDIDIEDQLDGPPADRKSSKKGKKEEAKVAESEIPETRFSDVAGADEAVEQMAELVAFLSDPEKFNKVGAKIPKGALLVGPPGTGKTLLARAVAGEAGVSFFAASGSDFVEMYVGVGPKRVRQLFASARKAERAIVFIDEIDAVARRRSDSDSSNSESENTLIALLNEMDGFEGSDVIVLAATNRADILDPALTRPGRLDRKIEVPLPDQRGREKILRAHASKIVTDDTVDLAHTAARTPGFSGAQMEAVVNEAALEAVRREADAVSYSDFDAAVSLVAMGRPRKSAQVSHSDRLVTAWHEGGHTLAAYLLKDAAPPVQVSIVPRGPAGGVTWMSGTDDQFMTRSRAHSQLVVALGGRAAEQLHMDGEFTQGASGDLQSATQTASAMVGMYGMTDHTLISHTEANADLVKAANELLVSAHGNATRLLTENVHALEALAEALMEHNDLDASQIDEICRSAGLKPDSVTVDLPNVPMHGLHEDHAWVSTNVFTSTYRCC